MNRRSAIAGSMALGAAALAPLRARVASAPRTRVYVLGTIHSTHRQSEAYSLDILRDALRRAKPDRLLAEIPPDRIAEAYRTFEETGRVTEARTAVFPEYVDVAFPLTREMGFRIIPTAGWTQRLAEVRSAALRHISRDPTRAAQWAEHRAAYEGYGEELEGRGDDPRFIHTSKYDVLVQRAQTPYQIYFDADLGPGGWTRINAAHNALIHNALDDMRGTGETAVITFGSWHKYMILRSLAQRGDIELVDPRPLFE